MFEKFAKAVHARFVEMSKGELYVTDVGDDLFDKYLAAFPEGTNPMFRQRTEHDCNCCKQFIRRLGKLVSIDDGEIVSVWDHLHVPAPYSIVSAKLADIVGNAKIVSVFRSKERKYGVDHNYDNVTQQRWDHFYGEVADRHYSKDKADTLIGEQNAIYQVAKRGLTELKLEHLDTVLDLIDSNSVYRGEEHRAAVVGFRTFLTRYNEAVRNGTDKTFIWANLDNRNARFRNTVIGSLLIDLAEGKDVEDAVVAFGKKVDPISYKRPTTIITQKMVEQAVTTLNELGLSGATQRRFARLSDISVNDVLFVDNGSRSKMKDGVALALEGSVKKPTINSDKTVSISAEEFVKTVLPKAKAMTVLVQNRHLANFISLTGGDGPERLFKWNNNFAWSYEGDVTDSVKQRVKAAGGNVQAKMRVSLSWFNTDDLDIHAVVPYNMPNFMGNHVHFANKAGILDVDMNAGSGITRNAVENLAFNDLRDGMYKIYVNQYRRRETIDLGFNIEVEFEGVVSQYSYSKGVSGDVPCFNLTVKDGRLVKIDANPALVGGSSSQEKWGITTESLVNVAAVMYSPNHWGDQKVGAKHLIFALEGCKNPEPARGIYNEFLRGDLDKHRKVFEVLGAKTKCKVTDDQVSGVGFTSARGDSVTVVVDGRRSYTLQF